MKDLVGHFISASCQGEKCCYVVERGKTLGDGMFMLVPEGDGYHHPVYPSEADTRCGVQATHKVGEEIAHDDPQPIRHGYTAYLCCDHFARVMGLGRSSACFAVRTDQ